jgi:hypothetical protein
MKKLKKPLTNEHLLKDLPNNFALAEAAIQIAYKNLAMGKEFNLEDVLKSVTYGQKPSEVAHATESNKD